MNDAELSRHDMARDVAKREQNTSNQQREYPKSNQAQHHPTQFRPERARDQRHGDRDCGRRTQQRRQAELIARQALVINWSTPPQSTAVCTLPCV